MAMLLYISAFLFSLGQLGRISFFGQQINMYLYEVLAGILLAVLIWRYRTKPLQEIVIKFKFTAYFFGFLFLSYFFFIARFSPFQNFTAFLYLLRFAVYTGLFFYGRHHVQAEKKCVRHVFYAIFVIVILGIVSVFVQYFLYPNLRNLQYLGWDPHLYRVFGLFFDVSVSGAFFGLSFLFAVFKLPALIKNKFVWRGIVAVLLLIIAFTYSRTVYLAFAIVMVGIAFEKKQYKYPILAGILFVIIFLLPKPAGEGVNLMRTFSIVSRADDYQKAVAIWKTQPIFGYGYNRIRYVKERFNFISPKEVETNHAGASFHSSFLIILVSSGVIGLLLYGMSLFEFSRINSTARWYIVFLALLSLSDNILLHPFALWYFFLLLIFEGANLSGR